MVGVSETLATYGDSIVLFAIIIFVSLLVTWVVGLMIWVSMHKLKLRIHTLTGSKTLSVKTYKARFKKRQGTTEIKPLNFMNKWITIEIKPPNEPGTWYLEGKNQVLNIYKTGNGSYVYIKFQKFRNEDPRYGIVDEDMKNWVAMQLRQTELKYAKLDWFSKYGTTVSIGMVGIIFLVGLIIISNMIPG